LFLISVVFIFLQTFFVYITGGAEAVLISSITLHDDNSVRLIQPMYIGTLDDVKLGRKTHKNPIICSIKSQSVLECSLLLLL
jgi:hypothetical protein